MIRDALGRPFQLSAPPRRVVSLVPSVTETLFDLGAGHSVIAVTDFCIFPENLDRPRVGGTKNPDVQAIRELKPDLVHMNLEENLKKHAQAIEEFAPVFVSEPKSVADVRELVGILGDLHGREERSTEFIAAVYSQLASMPRQTFTFACPIWKQPWMWCGGDTYVSDLVTCAGGRNVLADRFRYPIVPIEEAMALRPDIIFLPDEPYAFTSDDREEIARASGSRVIGPFPGHLFTWHGTRTLLGLRFLGEAL